MIPFEGWQPDRPALGNGGTAEALNVIPKDIGFSPLPSLEENTGALTAYCRGAAAALDKAKDAHFFAGDAGKLYRLTSTTWTDSSKSGGYSLSASFEMKWEFLKWGETMIASSFAAPLQYIDLTGTTFANRISSSASFKPQAHHIAAVGSFVVLGNTTDPVDGHVPNRIWWSGFEDPTDFKPDPATQCDRQDLYGNGGAVLRIIGGDYGTIFQPNSISRLTYEGPPLIFRIDEVEPGRGALCSGGIVNLGRMTFYLSEEGFFVFNGNSSESIGESKVDKTVLADIDGDYLDRVSALIDPVKKIVKWSYAGSGNLNGTPNKLVMFHWPTGKWSRGELEIETLANAMSAGYTLEQLDNISANIDSFPASLDDNIFKGGNRYVGAFNTSHKFASFTGVAMDAVLDTGEIQAFPGKRTFCNNVVPLIDGGSGVSVKIGRRDREADSVVWGNSSDLNINGECPVIEAGRYLRYRAEITGNFDRAIGVIPSIVPEGRR